MNVREIAVIAPDTSSGETRTFPVEVPTMPRRGGKGGGMGVWGVNLPESNTRPRSSTAFPQST